MVYINLKEREEEIKRDLSRLGSLYKYEVRALLFIETRQEDEDEHFHLSVAFRFGFLYDK